jgi:adenosine deaminase
MTEEFRIANETFGTTLDQLEKLTINGMKSAFAHYDDRIRVIFERIKPGYASLRKAQ